MWSACWVSVQLRRALRLGFRRTLVCSQEHQLLRFERKARAMARRIFVSFHQADELEVAQLQTSLSPHFDEVRTIGAKSLGDELDDRIDSDDSDYVMRRIRERYIAGTTCTIVAIGQCTWARRYVDWEIAATMRNNPSDPRGGIFAMQLPSAQRNGHQRLPKRLASNVERDSNGNQSGYGRFFMPLSPSSVQSEVEAAIRRAAILEPAAGSLSGLRRRSATCP